MIIFGQFCVLHEGLVKDIGNDSTLLSNWVVDKEFFDEIAGGE